MRRRLAHLRDLLLASDPALDRLRSGLRALFTALACAGAFLLPTRALGLDYKLSLPGTVVAMMAVVALQDPGRRQQQATMAWVPVVASIALVTGAFVADDTRISGALFLLTIFGAFQVRRLGPRGGGLGTIAYQSFFYALLFKTPPDKAAWIPVFVFAGCAIAWAIHFWIVPQHPGRMVHAELRAFRARIRALLHVLARRLDGDDDNDGRITIQLARLNAQSLALDARLAGFGQDADGGMDLRGAVLRTELAAETVAAVAQAAAGDARADRHGLARQMHSLQADDAHRTDAAATLPDKLRWRLDWALGTLDRCAPWRRPVPAMGDEKTPPQNRERPRSGSPLDGANGRRWFDDTTRRALQATVAALGALVAGRALSPDHWYWAVFAALVVFTRSVTVGQTVSGAWRQVLAAGGGVCVGMLVAELAHGHRALELALLFAFVGIGFYAYKGLQNLYVVLLTAMLAMLYELLGKDSVGLLLLRLGETMIGAASAMLSARFVAPVSTHDESDAKSAGLLRTAAGLLRGAFDAHPAPLVETVRELDRKLQGLRHSVGPVTGRANPASSGRLREQRRKLSTIAGRVRHFYVLGADGGLADSGRLRAAVDVLAPNLEKAADMLEEPDRDRRRQPDEGALPAQPDEGDVPLRVASGWLAETDEALRTLRQ